MFLFFFFWSVSNDQTFSSSDAEQMTEWQSKQVKNNNIRLIVVNVEHQVLYFFNLPSLFATLYIIRQEIDLK